MKFRPCIDIHNGKVKQIIGSSLDDKKSSAGENFVSDKDAAYYAGLYKENGLDGGHIILLNPAKTPEYEADIHQAKKALSEYPKGLQIGGGVNCENARSFIEMGASHVIVTSYVFKNGMINYENLKRICGEIGKERLVLDLSCRRKNDGFYIVTDRWQRFTDMKVTPSELEALSRYCGEFLVHAVDVEGKKCGIDRELVEILSKAAGCSITYAGGISSIDDIKLFHSICGGRLDFTVGSALDIFGGEIPFSQVAETVKKLNGLGV